MAHRKMTDAPSSRGSDGTVRRPRNPALPKDRGGEESVPVQTDVKDVRVFVTAERKADEIQRALERKGVRVEHCPALLTTSVDHDEDLIRASRRVAASRPDVVVVTTGVGLRGWLAAADRHEFGADLRESVGQARVLARGAKALGALRAEGIPVDWVSEEETAEDVARHLSGLDLSGRHVVVQHHGTGADGLDEMIESRGAVVEPIVTYKSVPTPDPEPLRQSIESAAAGRGTGVLFTSASGAEEWLTHMTDAERSAVGRRIDEGETALLAVGDVTARPLKEAGLTPRVPQRFRLGALLKLASAWADEYSASSQDQE